MAENLIKKYNLDKVIFVPVGNYYKKDGLIDAKHRYNMLKLYVEGNTKINVEDIAIKSKTKLHAVDTFKLITQKYSKDDIFFIMGSDNFKKLPEWKNYEELISNYNIIVIEREQKKVRHDENIISFIPEKLVEVNSTKIRRMIKNNDEEAKKYLNENVYEYIKKNELYM